MPLGPCILLRFVGLAGSHGVGTPLLGLRQIFFHLGRMPKVHVGLAPIDQVQIGHRVVVVGRLSLTAWLR